jgi:hypothetical protein
MRAISSISSWKAGALALVVVASAGAVTAKAVGSTILDPMAIVVTPVSTTSTVTVPTIVTTSIFIPPPRSPIVPPGKGTIAPPT